jgi:peptidoglycan/LPS O-acetylase OafA/YrhL
VHALILDFAAPWFAVGRPADVSRILRFFVISMAISAATYWLIEKPGIRLGRRLEKKVDAASTTKQATMLPGARTTAS